ncbi:hypothetical protein GGR55DRAFT_26443 [Xylaria sp. FL0064]|nr:hypothetical protein GGR55DRAFT_26443 [Xylaria sp. FL0064]
MPAIEVTPGRATCEAATKCSPDINCDCPPMQIRRPAARARLALSCLALMLVICNDIATVFCDRPPASCYSIDPHKLSPSPAISSCRAKKFTATTVMVRKRLVTHSTFYHDAMASDQCVGRCAGDVHHCTWVEHWGRQGTSRARGPGQLDPDSHDARGRRG